MDVPPPGVGAGCPFPRDSTTGKICGFLAHAVPESPPDGDQMMLPVVVPSEILDPVHVCPSGALAVVAKPKYRTHMPKERRPQHAACRPSVETTSMEQESNARSPRASSASRQKNGTRITRSGPRVPEFGGNDPA